MSPSWYDLLGVEPDATSEEVRAAWRTAIAGLDPTDRRFAVLNQAAAVVLDPARRAAYDRELSRAEVAAATDGLAGEPTEGPAEEPAVAPVLGAAEGTGKRRRGIPLWVPAGLGGLAVALAAAAVLVATTVPADDEVLSSTREAQASAERAIVPVLSYDHRTLEQDRAAAVAYLTDDFREEYEKLFTQIEESAPSTRAVVEAEVRASAITRGGHDRAQVLLFVDQPTTNARTSEPVVYRNQVTVTMERVGDRWLIDDLQTSSS